MDGQALAVCWRCLGLYGGAAVTAMWLTASGLWRRGLPSWSVFVAQVVALVAAMLGGLHVVNGPAAWKLTCGLWTGHVAVMWLIGGAQHLIRMGKWGQSQTLGQSPFPQLPWRKGDKTASLIALAALAAMALMLANMKPSPILLDILDVLAMLGALALLTASAAAAATLAVAAWRASRCWAPEAQSSQSKKF